MKRPGVLSRSKPQRRGSSSLRRTGFQESAAERLAREAFKAAVLEIDEHTGEPTKPCLWSTTRLEHVCSGPLDAHHLIEAQFLKHYFAHKREEELLEIAYDPRIGVPLCRFNAHAMVTNHADKIWLNELTLASTDFAADHDLVWRLVQECPERPR